MKTARVVGHVVSTIKHSTHAALKLMIVEYVDTEGKPVGKQQIVVDAACSGIGDFVLLLEDGGGSRIVLDSGAIIDTVIVGVIDDRKSLLREGT